MSRDETTFPVVYLTGNLPRPDPNGFYLLMMHLKNIGIRFPRDMRKMLWDLIQIVKFNGGAIFGPGTIIDKTHLRGDFTVLTVYPDDERDKINGNGRHPTKMAISFNDVPVYISRYAKKSKKTFLFTGALSWSILKIEIGSFIVESWSFTEDYCNTGKLKHPLNNLARSINSQLHKNLIAYKNCRAFVNQGLTNFDDLTESELRDIKTCVKDGLIKFEYTGLDWNENQFLIWD